MERVGFIDLGSNTARLVIIDILDGGYYVVVNEMKEAVRLGDMEKDGTLKTQRVVQAIAALKIFKKTCECNKVDKIIAVATAAVRQARSQKAFLNDVFVATGIKLRVLSESEEANYVYQGVINSMEIPKGIIMEIGGASTKLIYYNRRNILKETILPFGSVTLNETFHVDEERPEEQAHKIEEYVKGQLEQLDWLKEVDPDVQFIGVGGSFRSLSKISRKIKKYPLDMVHNYQLSRADFYNIYDMIKVLDLDKKMKIKGMSTARADVFPCALSVIKAFVDHMDYQVITTSGCGLREGYMFNYANPLTLEKPISDILGHSLSTYSKYLDLDTTHSEQVFNLCIQLFRQLRVLHKFPRAYIKVLRIAAMMHESGKCFKFFNYQKHSSYMILHSNLYGIGHKDLVLAAFVSDMFNKDEINMNDWVKYKELLTEEDVEAGKKLAVMLKLAVALDRSRSAVITEINCDVLGDSVIMKTETDGNDNTLEFKEAMSVAGDFRRVFKKNLEIL